MALEVMDVVPAQVVGSGTHQGGQELTGVGLTRNVVSAIHRCVGFHRHRRHDRIRAPLSTGCSLLTRSVAHLYYRALERRPELILSTDDWSAAGVGGQCRAGQLTATP